MRNKILYWTEAAAAFVWFLTMVWHVIWVPLPFNWQCNTWTGNNDVWALQISIVITSWLVMIVFDLLNISQMENVGGIETTGQMIRRWRAEGRIR